MLSILTIASVFFAFSTAYGFDFDRYKQEDLDKLLQLPRNETSVKVVAPQKLASVWSLLDMVRPAIPFF